MGIFDRFPTTKLNDINLDWILKKIKSLRGGTTNQVLAKASNADFDFKWVEGGGGGGTSDYNDLVNQPQINDVTLVGNQSASDLGLQAEITVSGILKGDGDGGVTAATPGSDYLGPAALMPYRTASAQDEIDVGKEPAGLGLTGASVGDLVRVAAVDTNGKPTSWKHVPLNEIVTNDNLLDNWYFVGGGSQQGGGQFPINQRGQTSYSNVGYGIDRWSTVDNSNPISLASNGVLIGNGVKVNQMIPREKLVNGAVYTISILYENKLFYLTGTIDTTLTSGWIIGNWSTDGIFIAIGALTSNLFFRINSNGATVQAVKLELGPEQTLAHLEDDGNGNLVWVLNEIPDYGEELAKCQRYYYRIPNECNMNAVNRAAENILRFSIPQNFAKQPTLVLNMCYVCTANGLFGPYYNPATSVYSRTDGLTTFNVSNSGYPGTNWETVSIIFHADSYITAE